MITLFVGLLALTGLAIVGLFWRIPRFATVLLIAYLAFLSWIFWFEPRSLSITHQTIAVEGLDAPVKIVAIGDPQPTAHHWPASRLRAAFATAQAQEPDIVLWLGDYVYESRFFGMVGLREEVFVEPAEIVAAMAELNAPMGAYAILGNHDWWWNGPEVARLIRQTPITLLIDEAVKATHPDTGAALWIAGLDDISAPRPTDLDRVLAATDDSAPVVVLSHSPDIFPRIPEGPALTLSGHTHCGQVWVPFLGRPVVPIDHKRYACGLYDEGGRRLFVTSGIGTAIIPMRFLTPPEVAVITLVPAAP